MNIKTTRQLLLTFTVILTVLVSLARVTPVLAEETIPPQTEPVSAEGPVEPQPSEPAEASPAVEPSGEPQPPEATEASPTGEASPTEPPAAEETSSPQEDLAQIVETLDQNDIVLVDSQGEVVPLATEEAAEALQGSDPWFVAADGSVIGYSATGTCAAVVTTCNTSSTPLAAAIAAAPAGSTIVIDGTYAEQVTINKNLTLQGATTGGTLRTPASVTQYGTVGTTRVYSLVQVTNNALVNFENLTIENRLLNGTVDTNPIDSYSGSAYYVGVWFNNGRGTINNSTIQEFAENSSGQDGIGIYVAYNSDSGVTVQYSNIYNNEYGIRVTGDNVTIQRNQIRDNTTGIYTGDGSSLDVHENNFRLGASSDTSFNDQNSSTISASNNYWVNESGTVCSYTGTGTSNWSNFQNCANITGLSDTQIGGTSGDSQTAWSLDPDGDGFSVLTGTKDNCPTVSNPSQADNDNDGAGDACDTDDDSDGDLDTADNCPLVYNPNQADSDHDGIGDACDVVVDSDGDGIEDGADNCPTTANADQANADGDSMGDACDPFPQDPQNDVDGDGVSGHIDNCPTVSNASQTDTDSDGQGDACDPFPQDPQNDVDGDGVSGHIDNCPTVSNASQANADGDAQGDACDPDDDNDGVLDGADICPGFNDNADADGDGTPDGCDAMPNDFDNDGADDGADNCPTTANASQTDTDGDGQGDACDAFPQDPQNDVDGDGVSGHIDNCPTTANASQTDTDSDGQGDACDAFPQDPQNDVDGDGVSGHIDNCPTTANADQANADGDGQGDACDTDDDDDGLLDGADSCPVTPNRFVDADSDGIDDACDPFIATPTFTVSTGTIGGAGAFVIPVTGRQIMKIDCANPTTIMQLDNSDRALFTGLCGYDAVLEHLTETSVEGLKELPDGMSYISGMSVSILEDNSPVKPLPKNGSVTISFFVPSSLQEKKLSILFWDAEAGEWVKLPVQQLKDGVVTPTDLEGKADAESPEVLSGVHTSRYRIEVTLTFGGTFVLVAE
ncbi:MAG: hypothetical protein HPY59_03345 [Anaerolineae bacterium]|nr:hypothetical protein [Anaerolineae bacterium]